MTREEESVAAIILFSQFRLKWRTNYETTEHNNQAAWNTNDQRPTFSLKDRSPQQKLTHTHKKKKAMSPQKGNTHARALRKKEGDGDA